MYWNNLEIIFFILNNKNLPELEMLEFKFWALNVDPPGFGGPFGLLAVKTAGSFAFEAAWISIVSRKGIFSFQKALYEILKKKSLWSQRIDS